jgi:hypothetical protein
MKDVGAKGCGQPPAAGRGERILFYILFKEPAMPASWFLAKRPALHVQHTEL